MASIKMRGSTYRITVSLGRSSDGRKLLESATFVPDPKRTDKQNERALHQFAEEFERRAKSGLVRGDRITFEEFAEEWLTNYGEKELEKTTIASYKHYLALIYPRIGNLPIASIRPSTIQSMMNSIRETGYQLKNGRHKQYSEETLRGLRIVASSIFSAAAEDRLITNNPCAVRRRRKQDREEKTVNAWSPQQAADFLDRIERPIPVIVPEHTAKRQGKTITIKAYTGRPINVATKYAAFFNLAIYGGCRRGELIALTWADIDFKKNTISISKATHYTAAAGQYDGNTKTKQSRREIFLPSAAMQKLKALKREQARDIMQLGSAWTGERSQDKCYVFTQETGQQMNIGTPLREFSRIVKAINSAGGQLPIIRLHDLRHTSASICLAAGLDPVAVAHRLGHSDATTTLRIYSHAFAENDQQVADVLEQAIEVHRKAL